MSRRMSGFSGKFVCCWAALICGLGAGSSVAGSVVALSSPLSSTAGSVLDRVLRERLASRPLCVITVAGPAAVATASQTLAAFTKRAGDEAAVLFSLKAVDADSADQPETVTALARCGGVIFVGDEASDLARALRPHHRDTALLRGIRALIAAGGVAVGVETMATALGDARNVSGESHAAMRYGVTDRSELPGLLIEDGLGLVPDVLLDRGCFSQGRAGRAMVALADRHRLRLAIGLDEDATVLFKDGVWEVLTESPVLVLDTKGAGHWNDDSGIRNGRLWLLSIGDRFEPSLETARAAMAKLPLGPTHRLPKIPRDPWERFAFLKLLAGTSALGEAELRIPSPGRLLVLRASAETTAAALRGRGTAGIRRGFFAGPLWWDLVGLTPPDEALRGTNLKK